MNLQNWKVWLQNNRIAVFGALLVTTLVLVSYHSSLRVGFIGDDWEDVAKAAQLNLVDYLGSYFDPTIQPRWYRPLYGVSVLAQYSLFGGSPEGYHVIQILFHLANSFLLAGIVWQLSKNWRLAWLSAGVFVGLPSINEAVFWVAVHDPLAMFFFLATVLFWIFFLQTRARVYYFAALAATIFALLAKESSVFLVVTLFLLDRLVIASKTTWRGLFRRYFTFGIVSFVYLLIELRVQMTSYFTNQWGYSIGFHMIGNFLHYLAVMVFPWGFDESANYFILMTALAVLLIVGFRNRSKLILFLGIQIVITIFPVTGFPSIFFYPRYVYSAAMVYSVLIALFFERLSQRFGNPKLRLVLIAILASLVLMLNSTMTSQAAEAKAEEARQMRVPLRDIYQQHPTYPPDTYLYFVEFPYPYILRNLRGMFYLRYGSNVTAWNDDPEFGGWDENRFANLRTHQNAWVYYLDAESHRHEIPVQRDARVNASLAFPQDYSAPIRLEGIEVTASDLKRGDELALLLYWRARGQIEKDYTVFVHLLNARDEIVLSEDAQPRGGRAPTSQWRAGKMIADVHILNLPRDLAPGVYRMEIGMYYLPTLARVQFVDEQGASVDHVVIESFRVSE